MYSSSVHVWTISNNFIIQANLKILMIIIIILSIHELQFISRQTAEAFSD